jgi:hypothetical protein
LNADTGKWSAALSIKGRTVYLGLFANYDDAVAVRMRAAGELYGEFSPDQVDLEKIPKVNVVRYSCRGEHHNKAKLTAAQVIEIRQSKLRVAVLAQQFGVSKSTVYHVRKGNSWKNIPMEAAA